MPALHRRYFLSVSASTPGSFLPSRNSSEAPPPVEMCVILSATPAAFTADTESPPPTIDVAPTFSATACAILKVPLAKRRHFEHAHRTVPDDSQSAADLFGESFDGLGSDIERHHVGRNRRRWERCARCALTSIFSATTWSVGSRNFSLCFLASFKSSRASSTLSSSTRDLPTARPGLSGRCRPCRRR